MAVKHPTLLSIHSRPYCVKPCTETRKHSTALPLATAARTIARHIVAPNAGVGESLANATVVNSDAANENRRITHWLILLNETWSRQGQVPEAHSVRSGSGYQGQLVISLVASVWTDLGQASKGVVLPPTLVYSTTAITGPRGAEAKQ